MPTMKDENFRFTSLEGIDLDSAVSKAPEQFLSAKSLPAYLQEKDPEESALLVMSGADFYSHGTANGIEFGSLKELGINFGPSGEIFSEDKFAQLAAARWTTGAYVRVAKNTKVSLPLRAAYYFQTKETNFLFRSLVILEEGAELNFIDDFSGDDDALKNAPLVSGILEFRLANGAKLKYSQVQNFGKNTQYFLRQRFDLARDAELTVSVVHVGGEKGQLRQDVHLNESGASAKILGSARGAENQHFDFWMNAEHTVPNTKSENDFFFVMDDNAKAVFNGMIRITETALNTDAYQKNRTLLLSKKASVHSIPKLEISTDQVKCSHGSSVTMVNPEQVHYLQSRGIPPAEAEQMIVQGFIEPVVQTIPLPSLCRRIHDSRR